MLDIPPEQIVKKSRLQPGRMLLADTDGRAGSWWTTTSSRSGYARQQPYGEWLDANLVHLRDLPIPNRRVERSSQERAGPAAQGLRLHL